MWLIRPGTGTVWCPHTNSRHEIVWRPWVIEIDGDDRMPSRTETFDRAVSGLSDDELDELRSQGFRF